MDAKLNRRWISRSHRAYLTLILLILATFSGGIACAESPTPEELVKGLKNEDAKLRRKAAKDLGRLGPKAKNAVAALVVALQDADPDVSISAAYAIGHIGPEAKAAIPALLHAFSDKRKASWGSIPGGSPTVHDAAWSALHGIGADSTPAIAPFLKSKDDNERGLALWVMGTAGEVAEPQLATIISLIDDSKEEVRYQAVRTLGSLTIKPEISVPALEAVLSKDDVFFQELAVLALAPFGPKAAASVPLLIKQLEHEDSTLRAFSAYALGEIGVHGIPAIPRLSLLVDDKAIVWNHGRVPDEKDGKVGEWAAKAIEKIKEDLARKTK